MTILNPYTADLVKALHFFRHTDLTYIFNF